LAIIKNLLKKNLEDLKFFLYDDDIEDLKSLIKRSKLGKFITFEQALDLLFRATKNPKYKEFTARHFGPWEEIKLTSELDDIAIISEFPLYEIAFYHAPIIRNKREVGDNTDFIWPYYREFIGSGHRVRSTKELLDKAERFNLPKEDYKYYIESRKAKEYSETSGFGVGWERMLQGILKMPHIHSVATFPRVHNSIYQKIGRKMYKIHAGEAR
jgi:aspartyl/asparaginyl-tRNA synthetase